MLEVCAFHICPGVGNLVSFASRADNQQRRFARAKLNVFNLANLKTRVEHHAADQIADVIPSRFKLRPFLAGNLQLAADQSFPLGDRIHSRELQNQQLFVRPKFFNPQLAPAVVGRKSEQPQADSEPVRNIAVQLDCDFATPPLGLPHTGQGNELAGDSGVFYSNISSVKRLCNRTPAAPIRARKARATRPFAPITLPTSFGATLSSSTSPSS